MLLAQHPAPYIAAWPILPGYFSKIPPLETPEQIFPSLSTHTAPTVSNKLPSSTTFFFDL